MWRALTAAEAASAETSAAAEHALTLDDLMAAAGAALARELADRVPAGGIVVVAGPGNNGGDGWVAAHELASAGRDVRVVTLRDPAALCAPAASAARAAIAGGVRWTLAADDEPAIGALAGAAAIVDAVLGTGATLPLSAHLAAWCSAINASGAYVVSADLPTGVDTDTGAASAEAVRAHCTVAFGSPKRAHVLHPAAAHAGEIVVADIGIPRELLRPADAPEVWSAGDYADALKVPRLDAHKNDRGRVLVIAGSARYPGAAVLAARGAMRSGAGYVTLAVPEPVVAIAQAHLLAAPVVGLPAGRTRGFAATAGDSLIDLAADYDAVVVGPGLTLADGAVATARTIVAGLAKPLVIDADALNALVDATHLLDARTAPTLLTPHPGELGRLLGVSSAEVQADRLSFSDRLAAPGRAVVLKGANTVVSGEGRQVVVTAGSPALATAGTGDVLAGILGGLLAQGYAPLEAGALGAWLHGRAGDAAAAALTPMAVIAEDLDAYVPEAYAELLGDW